MKIHCPQCRGTFRIEGEDPGSTFDCPFCHSEFQMADEAQVTFTSDPSQSVTVEVEAIPPPPSAPSPPPPAAADDAADAFDFQSQPTVRHDPDQVHPAQSTAPRYDADPESLTDFKIGDQVGGYVLQSVLGHGGMSVVFRARQISLNRSVAIKVLRKDLSTDPEFAKRFLKEAQALAELTHPNIVSVFDQGVHDGHAYLAMEYVDGVSLREVMRERRLTPAEALKLVPQLCDALEYAHAQGLIHRDIKPENILLDKGGRPKIADFGLVRMVGDDSPGTSRLTKTQTVMGTLDYMAPEQREGSRDIDHRADIYSLGVVFYEMLTGELPIARFPLPSERVQVDVRLDEVVLKVLAKDRDHRYQRASMMATDLDRLQYPAPKANRGWSQGVSTEKVLRLVTSPLVMLFTAAFVIALAVDEEPALFMVGAAVPFMLAQFILHKMLRPIPCPTDLPPVRHPILFFGVLTVVSIVVACEGLREEELACLLSGFCISAGLTLAFWRDKVLIDPGSVGSRPSDSSRGDSDEIGLVDSSASRTPQQHWQTPGNYSGVPPLPGAAGQPLTDEHLSTGPVASSGGAQVSSDFDDEQPVSYRRPKVRRIPVESGMDVSSRPAPIDPQPPSPASPPAPPDRPRTSVLAVVAALVTFLFFFYALVPAVVVNISSVDDLVNAGVISSRDLRSLTQELFKHHNPENVDLKTMRGLTLALYAPLLIPLFLLGIATIRILSKKKRGLGIVVLSFVFLLIQTLIVTAAIQHPWGNFNEYRHSARSYSHNASLYETADQKTMMLLSALPKEHDTPRTMALFHVVYEIATREQVSSATLAYAQEIVAVEAVNSRRSALARNAATVLLPTLVAQYPDDIVFPEGVPQPVFAWISGANRIHNAVDRGIEEGLLKGLSKCDDSRLSQYFWRKLKSYNRDYAVQWWETRAPLASLHDFGKFVATQDSTQIRNWLDALDGSTNPDFRQNAEVREALLAPLIDHEFEFISDHARKLIGLEGVKRGEW